MADVRTVVTAEQVEMTSADRVEKVTLCYDAVAESYAEKFLGELEHKPLDRLLLQDFAARHKDKGRVIDFGCGPGQTTRFMFDAVGGEIDVTGTDLSPAMIAQAKAVHKTTVDSGSKGLHFEVANMLNLQYSDASFAGAIAFYAVVNFTTDQLLLALREISRVLTSGAEFLFCFHCGSQVIHLENFLDKGVEIDFFFFETEKVLQLLADTGFRVAQCLVRYPYSIEHQSQRAYVTAVKL
jgi:ubiquinone/menaquinone biosynthesis C-methylase UbiE